MTVVCSMPKRWHWRDMHRQQPAPIIVHRATLRGDHPPHDHDFLEIVVVSHGGAVHRHAGGDEAIGVGDALVVRPHTWHAYRDGSMTYWDCLVPAEVLRRELSWTAADPVMGRLLWSAPFEDARTGILRLQLPSAMLAMAQEQLAALADEHDARDPSRRTVALGRLLILAGTLAGALAVRGTEDLAGSAAHPLVQRAIAILLEDPARDWPLCDLAAEVGIAPAYLVRLFSAATGMPPRAWLIRHRLELASGLLLRSELPVAEIGAQVGWADANLFARRFRTQYGCSASTWRARYRDGGNAAVPAS
jgi:AraC family transcriptional regulator, L-rhamnose operon transcriptional activator RhaR